MHRKTGLLLIEGEDHQQVLKVRVDQTAMQDKNVEHELISGRDLRSKIPELNYTKDHAVLVDPSGTMLRANKCLLAMQVNNFSL